MLLSDVATLDEAERRDILAQLPSLEGMHVLELGAGIGRYTSHFVQVARHVTAVDFVGKFLKENHRTTAPSKDNPNRYRSDEEYTRLFEKDFSLLHRGNGKIYDEPFNNPHQHYWLFQR